MIDQLENKLDSLFHWFKRTRQNENGEGTSKYVEKKVSSYPSGTKETPLLARRNHNRSFSLKKSRHQSGQILKRIKLSNNKSSSNTETSPQQPLPFRDGQRNLLELATSDDDVSLRISNHLKELRQWIDDYNHNEQLNSSMSNEQRMEISKRQGDIGSEAIILRVPEAVTGKPFVPESRRIEETNFKAHPILKRSPEFEQTLSATPELPNFSTKFPSRQSNFYRDVPPKPIRTPVKWVIESKAKKTTISLSPTNDKSFSHTQNGEIIPLNVDTQPPKVTNRLSSPFTNINQTKTNPLHYPMTPQASRNMNNFSPTNYQLKCDFNQEIFSPQALERALNSTVMPRYLSPNRMSPYCSSEPRLSTIDAFEILRKSIKETKYTTAVFESGFGGLAPILDDLKSELCQWLGNGSHHHLVVACEVHWSVPEKFRSRPLEIKMKDCLHESLRRNNGRILELYDEFRLPYTVTKSKTEENCAMDQEINAFQGIYRRYYPDLLSLQDQRTIESHKTYWSMDLSEIEKKQKKDLLPKPKSFIRESQRPWLNRLSVIALNMAVLRLDDSNDMNNGIKYRSS